MFRLSGFHRLKLFSIVGLTTAILLGSSTLDDGVWAKKKKEKKKGPSAEEIEKKLTEELTPLNENLNTLLVKIQSRAIFSPEDSGHLVEIHYQLLSLLKQYPTHELLVQPVYQAGVLQMSRENYDQAFEMFRYLEINFPENPFTARAQHQFKKMRREMLAKGYEPDYFPEIQIAQPEEEMIKPDEKKKKS